jgi:hypothetical protein
MSKWYFPQKPSGIAHSKQPKFRPDNVVVPLVRESQGLYYLEEHFPKNSQQRQW